MDRVCEDPQVREVREPAADLRRHAYDTVRPRYLDGAPTRPARVRIMGWQPMHLPSLHVITGEPAPAPLLLELSQLVKSGTLQVSALRQQLVADTKRRLCSGGRQGRHVPKAFTTMQTERPILSRVFDRSLPQGTSTGRNQSVFIPYGSEV